MWLEAARPRTLPAAASPVLVAGGLAAHDGAFRLDAFWWALLGAVAIQVAANFANDVSDAARGADRPERIGPRRLVAAGLIPPRSMWVGVLVAVAVAVAAGVALTLIAGWVVVAIGVVSLAAMLTYVGGPAPYGYRGWGEVSVFLFFGLVATVGARYVHDRSAPLDAWLAGGVMGCFAAAILVVNNLRDLATDRASGKRTLAVILGPSATRRLYAGLLTTAYLGVAAGVVSGVFPVSVGLTVFTLPVAVLLVRRVWLAGSPAELIPVLAGTARLQLLAAVCMAAALAVG